MPEAISNPERPVSGNLRKVNPGIAFGLVLLTIAFIFYLRLFSRAPGRSEVFAFFFHALLPAAMIHAALLLLLTFGLKIRARGALLFWTLSAAVLLGFGGWKNAQAFLLILLFGLVFSRIGSHVSRYLLVPASQSWGMYLALGLVMLSVVGAFLAWFHLFKWWILAPLIVIALAPDLRSRMSILRSDVRRGWNSFLSGWDLGVALMLEAMFLLGAYAYVTAVAPETHSDAVRFYWPYIRLLRHYSGFFDVQRQWSYIIPQAGVTYAAAVLSLLGNQAVRLSMLLPWSALIGIVCRRTGQHRSARYAVAVVVASCPVILWVAPALMLDIFLCAAIAVLAVLCVEGREPGSSKFWMAIGVCAATAWAAKFTALAYVVPLVAYAGFRSYQVTGISKTLRGMIYSACSFLVTLSPWLANSYRQSGNPVFPFLLKLFPSPLWPRGVDAITLSSYRLPSGWRGWLLWPIDLTYHTSRFVEGYDGKLGLTLLVLLLLALLIIWKGNAGSRALVVTGIIATALLWTRTAYLRYWMPSLWLMAMAACGALEKRVRPIPAQRTIAFAAFVIMIPQVLFSMVNYWPSPRGWPWEVYARKVSWQDYLGGQFQSLSEEIERSQILDRRWPKIWFTGYEAVGHLQVQPMEATVWEFSLHTLGPRSKVQYLCTAGCDYWIVNEDDLDALWFKAEGISNFFWKESHLVARTGALAVYRMPSVDQALQEFDARALPATELVLNGSFEQGKDRKPDFWIVDGEARQLSLGAAALEGKYCLQLNPKAVARQGIALPPGVQKVEFLANARSGQDGPPVTLRYSLYALGFEKDPATIPPERQVQPERALDGKAEMVSVAGQWQQYRAVITIPNLARYFIVSVDNPGNNGEIWIDSVHLYSR